MTDAGAHLFRPGTIPISCAICGEEARFHALTNPDAGARQRLVQQLVEHLRVSFMGYTERFDHSAERFYRATGFMAPGKSVPLEMAASQHDSEREAAWMNWQQQERDTFRQLLRDAIAAIAELEAVPEPPPLSPIRHSIAVGASGESF